MGTTPPREDTLPADGAEPRTRVHQGSLGEGDAVGRYVVSQELGAGGMGVVYAAYDPELDRKVALKFLRGSAYGGEGEDRRRLRREAQAMAKLSHPNVITVHDVGEHEGAVYIAMESVEGQTLRAWLADGRPWQEVLKVFIAAGEGLAAAHAAGIVHRDFKPENVMIGDDGRVRVMDFGLAAPTATGKLRALSEKEAGAPPLPLGERIAPKHVLGTPAYMAPEQYQDLDVGRRADQFAFCVALWEGLYGERPFRSDSPLSVVAAASSGRRPKVPTSDVPARVRKAVQRGFAIDPADRWPSIAELLATLGSQGRSTGRTVVVAGLVVVLGLAAVVAADRLWRARAASSCDREGAKIADVWGPAVRDTVTTEIVEMGGAHARETAERIAPWLDDYAARWQQARTEICLDATPRQRSVACMEQRRQALAELVDRLRNADTDTLVNAVTAASQLPTIDLCRDAVALERLPAPPAGQYEQVQEIRRRIARARALGITGAPDEAVRVARAALADAQALKWQPLQAEAGLALGELLESSDANDETESTLEAAYFDATRSGSTPQAFRAARRLAHFVGSHRARPEDGRRWANLADVAREQLPTLSGLHESSLLITRAAIERTAGDVDEAVRLAEQALELSEAALGPDHLRVASALNTLGNAKAEQGAYEEGSAYHERALAIREAALGPTHPYVASVLANLARSDLATGHPDRALQRQQRALEIKEAVRGPNHESVAVSLNNVAVLRFARGEDEEAKALYERALAIFEQVHGFDHPRVARAELNLGKVARRSGEFDAAQRRLDRALAVYERVFGPEHVQVAEVLNQLGLLAFNRQRYDDARGLLARAVQILEAKVGPEHPHLGGMLSNHASAVEAEGDLDEARALYERALAILTAAEGPAENASHPLLGLSRIARAKGQPATAVTHAERALELRGGEGILAVDLAEARFELARALEAVNPGTERARTLAEQAAEAYRELGRPELAEVERFRNTLRP